MTEVGEEKKECRHEDENKGGMAGGSDGGRADMREEAKEEWDMKGTIGGEE